MKKLVNKGSSIKQHLPKIHPDFANVENTIGEPMDQNLVDAPVKKDTTKRK